MLVLSKRAGPCDWLCRRLGKRPCTNYQQTTWQKLRKAVCDRKFLIGNQDADCTGTDYDQIKVPASSTVRSTECPSV